MRLEIDPTDREIIRRIVDARTGTECTVRTLMPGALRDMYADLAAAVRGADLLVRHPITVAAPVLADRERLPWVSSVLAPMSFLLVARSPGVRADPVGQAPGADPWRGVGRRRLTTAPSQR